MQTSTKCQGEVCVRGVVDVAICTNTAGKNCEGSVYSDNRHVRRSREESLKSDHHGLRKASEGTTSQVVEHQAPREGACARHAWPM